MLVLLVLLFYFNLKQALFEALLPFSLLLLVEALRATGAQAQRTAPFTIPTTLILEGRSCYKVRIVDDVMILTIFAHK